MGGAHDQEIRARLAQGDEDSVVNLWLYGTMFTTLPRATEQELAAGPRARAEELLIRRLDDLVTGIASPGSNERLQFARQLVERQGINPSTEEGREQARVYLVKVRERAIAEYARYRKAAEAGGDRDAALTAYATLYRDRGLSSDTKLTADFALDKAIEAIAAKGTLRQQSVLRVAIVGPGLDFTDKAEGFDFYPQQTIQPFALVDSLGRFGLGQPDIIRVTTLDLSPRVNGHLESARARASRGEPYVRAAAADAGRSEAPVASGPRRLLAALRRSDRGRGPAVSVAGRLDSDARGLGPARRDAVDRAPGREHRRPAPPLRTRCGST